MFGQARAQASARYRHVDVSARVAGASPHRLVALLYEELLTTIATAAAAARAGDRGRRGERQARALTLLQALDASLDFETGGAVAASLATVYREVRRLLMAGVRESVPEHFDAARALIADIAGAWEAIG